MRNRARARRPRPRYTRVLARTSRVFHYVHFADTETHPQNFFVLRNAYSNGIATVQERDYLARFHAHKTFLHSVPVPCLEHVGWVEPSFLSQGNSSNDPRDINGCLVVSFACLGERFVWKLKFWWGQRLLCVEVESVYSLEM